eukprot:scaffold22186_cov19-Tisochrysis_lutea.AAC.1
MTQVYDMSLKGGITVTAWRTIALVVLFNALLVCWGSMDDLDNGDEGGKEPGQTAAQEVCACKYGCGA